MRPSNEGNAEAIKGLPHYDLTLHVNIQHGILTGREKLIYVNHEDIALKEIVLRPYPNLPQSPECNCQDRMRVGGISIDGRQVDFPYEALNTAMIIPLLQPLPIEGSTTIEMDFEVGARHMRDMESSLFLSNVGHL